MKHLMRHSIALLMGFSLIWLTAIAQDQKKNQPRARGIDVEYDEGKADGMRVSIKKSEGGQYVPVRADYAFKTGDDIKVQFESNFDGYVYIVNIDPSGKSCIIFPYPKETDNSVQARKPYMLPASELARFRFTADDIGIEVLQVYMARRPIKLFDETIKNAMSKKVKPCLAATAASAANELQAGISTQIKRQALSENESGGLRSRSVDLYLGEPNDKKETTIAIEQKKNSDGILKEDEFAVYEIRLAHK